MALPTKLRLAYYPWITQNVDAGIIDREVKRFAVAVQNALIKAGSAGAVVLVLPPVDVPKQVEAIAGGGCEIALMNPLGYVFSHRRNANVESVAVAQRLIDGQVGDSYYAQVYVNKRSAIRKTEQLRGRTIGYGTPFSTSNFLIPALEIKKSGLHPFAGFSRIEFVGGHELVAKAVYEGRLDVGAGHDGVIADLSNQYGYGDAAEKLVRVIRSAPIPSDPVAVNVADPASRKLVQDALVAAAGTTEGREALAIFWGNVQGLSRTTADAYASLEKALTELGLTESDLLKPAA
jgi:phosphonate transport system substrate-binding protein